MDCSFVSQSSPCGSVGPGSILLPLEGCKADVTTHLAALGISGKRGWHTSGNILSEKDLILNRAGHFHFPDERVAAMTICPKHRRELTVDWSGRKRKTCGYPTHQGQRRQMHNPRRINFATSLEIFNRRGDTVPAGTGMLSLFSCENECSFLDRFSQHDPI